MPADCQGHCPGQALLGPHGAPAEPGPLLLRLVLLRLLWLHTPAWPRLPGQGHPPASAAPAPTPVQPPPPVLPARFPAAPAPLLQRLQEPGVDSVPHCAAVLEGAGRWGWGGPSAAPSSPNHPLAHCCPHPGTMHSWPLLTIILERDSQSRAPGLASPTMLPLVRAPLPPNLDTPPHSPGALHSKGPLPPATILAPWGLPGLTGFPALSLSGPRPQARWGEQGVGGGFLFSSPQADPLTPGDVGCPGGFPSTQGFLSHSQELGPACPGLLRLQESSEVKRERERLSSLKITSAELWNREAV